MHTAIQKHWPEYLMEAAGLGLFMISACLFAIVLFHPGSPLLQALPDPMLRRVLMGLVMGGTAIGLIYSPWGQQSGAHLNPSTTVTFWRLGKVEPWDVVFYILAQFMGGILGVALSALVWGSLVAEPHVYYVVTVPGTYGTEAAFVAEVLITFVLMSVILQVSNTPWLARYTGYFAGLLVAVYISIEAPLSSMSMNPARTFASAGVAQEWTALWVYFTAPLLGMLLAAELYARGAGVQRVFCAKLHHHNTKRCIFRCGYATS
jgi:aquaporin Z